MAAALFHADEFTVAGKPPGKRPTVHHAPDSPVIKIMVGPFQSVLSVT
jgi:hypothetical protein